MKSNVLITFAVTWFSAAIGTVTILTLSNINVGLSIFIAVVSILVINTLHTLFIQLVALPATSGESFGAVERFAAAMLPWLVVSSLIVILSGEDKSVGHSIIAIQYCTAALSYHFYSAEIRKQEQLEKEYWLLQKKTDTDSTEQITPNSTE